MTSFDIALRLSLALVAGVVIGVDRGEHGRPAGLRTNVLVCLAACVAMIQVNLLLGMSERPHDSFVMLDLMRLPLGILSGMGFIGGGAIMKRGNLVVGVTTAATLWFVTVIGLCFGGGQILLGLVALGLGLLTLTALKRFEFWLPRTHRGKLSVSLKDHTGLEKEIRQMVEETGYRVSAWGTTYSRPENQIQYDCDLHWRSTRIGQVSPNFLASLYQIPEISQITWSPEN